MNARSYKVIVICRTLSINTIPVLETWPKLCWSEGQHLSGCTTQYSIYLVGYPDVTHLIPCHFTASTGLHPSA